MTVQPDQLLVDLLDDLDAEGDALDELVAPLTDEQWRLPTPAPGWTIAHQVAHLAWTDDQAVAAATDPEFAARVSRLLAEPDLGEVVSTTAEFNADESPRRLRECWHRGRQALAAALLAVPSGAKLPWFGPPMGTAMMATARLMETWAHGQDVADTLGVNRPATGRLRHVAHIAVAARSFAFRANGIEPPVHPIRVELVAPEGSLWIWGPEDATQRVTAPALDFCLLATQRRHRADVAVNAVGDDADRWLDIAQAFAGPPGEGRRPGQFR